MDVLQDSANIAGARRVEIEFSCIYSDQVEPQISQKNLFILSVLYLRDRKTQVVNLLY